MKQRSAASADTAPAPAAHAAEAAGPLESAADADSPLVEARTPEELAAQWEAEAPPPAGPVANLAASLVALAIGAGAIGLSLSMGLGTLSHPKPGTWPFIVGLVVTVLSLAQLLLGRRGGADGEKFSKLSWLAAFGLATLVGLVALMPVVGFEIPSLLLSFVWMKFLGGESWRSAGVYSLLVVVAFYAIFILGLGTSIPHLF